MFFEYANEKWLIAYFGEDTELSLPAGEAYGLYTHALSMGDYTSIVVPDNVTKINDYAFMSNYRLSSLTVGSGVRLIGKNAFNACPAPVLHQPVNGLSARCVRFHLHVCTPCRGHRA